MQDEEGENGGEHNGNGGCETLDNVVRVGDHGRNEQTAERIQEDDEPHEVVEALVDAVSGNDVRIDDVHIEQAEENAEKTLQQHQNSDTYKKHGRKCCNK